MSEGDGSWFIINSRNKPVYGKNEHVLKNDAYIAKWHKVADKF